MMNGKFITYSAFLVVSACYVVCIEGEQGTLFLYAGMDGGCCTLFCQLSSTESLLKMRSP